MSTLGRLHTFTSHHFNSNHIFIIDITPGVDLKPSIDTTSCARSLIGCRTPVD